METSDAGTRAGYALLSILLILSWVFAGLRFYIRLVRRNAGWDDTFIFLSVLCYSAFTVFSCGLVANGLGEDIDESREDADVFSRGSFYFLFSELFFILASMFVRIGCAIMLLRIMHTIDSRLRNLIYITVATMVAYSVAFFFITLFQCSPVSYFWTYMLESDEKGHNHGFTEQHSGGHCINDNTVTGDYTTLSTLFTIHSVICAISDWTLGVVPFMLLRNLQMNNKEKVTIAFLLGLGIIAGVAAVVRCPLIINANKVEFWDAAIPVAITTAIEPVLGIISVSIPTLAPLLPWKPRERLNSTSDGRSEQPSSKKSYRMGRMTKKSSRWPEHQSQEVVGPSPTDTSIERAIWAIEENSDMKSHIPSRVC